MADDGDGLVRLRAARGEERVMGGVLHDMEVVRRGQIAIDRCHVGRRHAVQRGAVAAVGGDPELNGHRHMLQAVRRE